MPYSDLDMAPRTYRDFEDRWKWILTYMVLEDKFVHEILMMMEKSSTSAIPTMGVYVEDARIILKYNLEFTNSLTDPELRYVVTHEIYHVVLHHCTVRLPLRVEDRKLYNVAADLAINSLIPESPSRHMPKMKDAEKKDVGVLPKHYGFPEKLSMEQYVLLLREKNIDCSGAGGLDSHDGWSDADAEVVKQIIRNKIDEVSKKEAAWSSLPGDVQQIIKAAQTSTVRWWKYLRHYLGTLVTTKVESTFKKPNRRYGYPYCGTKRKHTDRKLLAIDTSGSIQDEDLSHFLAEVNKLCEVQPVDLVQFDHQIQGKVTPFDHKRTVFDFKGRGGTAFTPVFELAEKQRYQSLIILTDGCAEAPPRPTRVKDVLWVLTAPGYKPPVPWGTRVWIVPKGASQPTETPATADDTADDA
jgi:predicted metal-dependent peptidase